MLIDFNNKSEIFIAELNGGNGTVSAEMFMDAAAKIMISRLAAGASIGLHFHYESSVMSERDTAFCGRESETLTHGVCHYCPRGLLAQHNQRRRGRACPFRRCIRTGVSAVFVVISRENAA